MPICAAARPPGASHRRRRRGLDQRGAVVIRSPAAPARPLGAAHRRRGRDLDQRGADRHQVAGRSRQVAGRSCRCTSSAAWRSTPPSPARPRSAWRQSPPGRRPTRSCAAARPPGAAHSGDGRGRSCTSSAAWRSAPPATAETSINANAVRLHAAGRCGAVHRLGRLAQHTAGEGEASISVAPIAIRSTAEAAAAPARPPGAVHRRRRRGLDHRKASLLSAIIGE